MDTGGLLAVIVTSARVLNRGAEYPWLVLLPE